MGIKHGNIVTELVEKQRTGHLQFYNMIGNTLLGFVVVVLAAATTGHAIADKESEDSYESLQLLQMSTIHDLVKTLTSKVDAMSSKVNGIDAKVNSLSAKVEKNGGKIGGIVDAVDKKLQNLAPVELSYGYLEYTKYIGKTYPRSSSTHMDSAHTSVGQCNAFCLKVKKERSTEDWNAFSYRPSDGYCYCWRSAKSFSGNNGYQSYTLES